MFHNHCYDRRDCFNKFTNFRQGKTIPTHNLNGFDLKGPEQDFFFEKTILKAIPSL